MFDISFTELMLIGVVALVVIGPERLPKVARTVGHLLGRAQRYVSDVKGDIQREVELDELRKMKEEMEAAARDVQQSMEKTEVQLKENLQSPMEQVKSEIEDLTKSDPIHEHLTATSPQPAVSDQTIASSSASTETKA